MYLRSEYELCKELTTGITKLLTSCSGLKLDSNEIYLLVRANAVLKRLVTRIEDMNKRRKEDDD